MAKYWEINEKGRLAEEIGISRQYLSDILARRRRVSVSRAKALQYASAMVLGIERAIPWAVWADPMAEHPAFKESA